MQLSIISRENFNKNQTKHTNFHGEVVFAGPLLVLLSRPMIQRAMVVTHLDSHDYWVLRPW